MCPHLRFVAARAAGVALVLALTTVIVVLVRDGAQVKPSASNEITK
jgi:hypothetical protein